MTKPEDFPHTVFVRIGDEEGLVEAFQSAGEAIEDDGPTMIGEYRLVGTQAYEKVIEKAEPVSPAEEAPAPAPKT
jgi:hypothetical protein